MKRKELLYPCAEKLQQQRKSKIKTAFDYEYSKQLIIETSCGFAPNYDLFPGIDCAQVLAFLNMD